MKLIVELIVAISLPIPLSIEFGGALRWQVGGCYFQDANHRAGNSRQGCEGNAIALPNSRQGCGGYAVVFKSWQGVAM